MGGGNAGTLAAEKLGLTSIRVAHLPFATAATSKKPSAQKNISMVAVAFAPGDAGKPKDVEYIKKIDEGKDQAIVNIPHEQTEAFKKKRESLKASVIEKLRRRESEVLGKAAGTNAKDKEGKGKKGDVGGANVKANGEKKDADGDDVMTDAERRKKMETMQSPKGR